MKVELPQFTGPYDLLLALVGEKKLNVSELALSQVTEQFLAYVDGLEEDKADELADFLVVATRLLLLKARLLLPQFAVEDDEGPGLEEQLKLYKAFVDASKKVNKLWLSLRQGFAREEPPRRAEGFQPGNLVTLEHLRTAMVQLVRRLAPPKPLPQTHIDKAVSLKERIDHIRTLLARSEKLNFHELLSESRNKTEIIISFLAILELMKQRTLTLHQDESFTDIVIEKISN